MILRAGTTELTANCQVWIDGVKRTCDVVEVDTERACALVLVRDASGQIQLTLDRNGVAVETVYGHIRVAFTDVPPSLRTDVQQLIGRERIVVQEAA